MTIVVQRSSNTSTPTMPNAAVKIRSRYVFANTENGPTHPCFWLAVNESVQTVSTIKGGVWLSV